MGVFTGASTIRQYFVRSFGFIAIPNYVKSHIAYELSDRHYGHVSTMLYLRNLQTLLRLTYIVETKARLRFH